MSRSQFEFADRIAELALAPRQRIVMTPGFVTNYRNSYAGGACECSCKMTRKPPAKKAAPKVAPKRAPAKTAKINNMSTYTFGKLRDLLGEATAIMAWENMREAQAITNKDLSEAQQKKIIKYAKDAVDQAEKDFISKYSKGMVLEHSPSGVLEPVFEPEQSFSVRAMAYPESHEFVTRYRQEHPLPAEEDYSLSEIEYDPESEEETQNPAGSGMKFPYRPYYYAGAKKKKSSKKAKTGGATKKVSKKGSKKSSKKTSKGKKAKTGGATKKSSKKASKGSKKSSKKASKTKKGGVLLGGAKGKKGKKKSSKKGGTLFGGIFAL